MVITQLPPATPRDAPSYPSAPAVPDGSDNLVLCYHAVSQSWPSELSVTPELLGAQLERLVSRGYRGVTFSEAALGRRSGKTVAVTFDDGYASTYGLARPILDRLDLPGTVFVVTNAVGGGPMSWPGIDGWLGTEHENELLPMSWEQARELGDSGWEVGSHTTSHPYLTRIPDPELERELTQSRDACEQMLGRGCNSICYPYGDHDPRVVSAAATAGYAAGATLVPAMRNAQPGAWPRTGIYNRDSLRTFRLKTSRLVRRFQRSPAASRSLAGAAEVLARVRR